MDIFAIVAAERHYQDRVRTAAVTAQTKPSAVVSPAPSSPPAAPKAASPRSSPRLPPQHLQDRRPELEDVLWAVLPMAAFHDLAKQKLHDHRLPPPPPPPPPPRATLVLGGSGMGAKASTADGFWVYWL